MSEWKYEDSDVKIVANEELKRRYFEYLLEDRYVLQNVADGKELEEWARKTFLYHAELLAQPESLDKHNVSLREELEEAKNLRTQVFGRRSRSK